MRPAARHRPAAPAAGRWYRLRGFELAIGFVPGSVRPSEPGDLRPARSPRAALEDVLLGALRRPPCVVAFSGGRDSSAMLALAVHVARRHGLPDPIPVTRRFPDVPAAGEDEWQTLVVRHLGVREWVRLTLHDECDLVGPLARRVLHRHGVVWPPTLHVNIPVFEVARGGTVVTGDGGDEVFGPHRATPLLHVLSGGRRRRGAWRHLPGAIGPARVRRRFWEREVGAETPASWLLPRARERLVRVLVDEHVAAPLSWRAAVRRVPLARAWATGAANRQLLADGYGVQVVHPLLSPEFLRAYAAAGRVLGPLTRAEAMRGLFGDVLPDEVVRRRSKARFNAALLSGPSRRFARRWSGGGLDTGLVDEERLRAEWLSAEPHAASLGLLQAAWLHAHGGQPAATRI